MKNKYQIKGDYVEVFCNGRGLQHTFLIDLEDLDRVSKCLTWYVGYNKGRYESIKTHGRQINGKRDNIISLHRFLLNPKKSEIIDHINGNIFDNRKKNLRICSPRINSLNKNLSSSSMSKHRNIYFEENKYGVRVRITKFKYKRFGRYSNLQDAINKRNEIYEEYKIPYYEV